MRCALAVSMITALAGCGDGRRVAPDAAPPADATPDAPPRDVTVIVKNHDGTAAALIPTYFQDADSTVVAATVTDPTGATSARLAAGGFVSIFDPEVGPALADAAHHIFTWAGVQPGDVLIYDTSGIIDDFPIVTFQVPADTTHAGVTGYDIETTCGGQIVPAAGAAPVSQQIQLFGCDGTADVLVTSLAEDRALGYFYVAAQPIADLATVDYAGHAYASVVTRTFTLAGNDAPAAELDLDDTLATSRGRLITAYAAATPTDPAVASLAIAPPPPNVTDVVHLVQHVPNTTREQLIWGTAGDLAIDYAAARLPDFTGAPSFDHLAHTLAVPLAAAASAPDFTTVTIAAARDTDTWTWQLATAHAATLAFPTVPADRFDPNLDAHATVTVGTLVTGKVPGGYDAVRARIFQFLPHAIGAAGAMTFHTYAAMGL